VGLRVQALEVVYFAVAIAAGCSLDPEGLSAPPGDGDGGRSPDTAMGFDTSPSDTSSSDAGDPDAAQDATMKDAKLDGITVDQDAPSDAEEEGDAASIDGSVTYSCPVSEVPLANCTGCTGYPLACVYCAGKDEYVGECLQGGLHCDEHVPDDASMCSCHKASQCVVADQVCGDGGCGTCGQADSMGLACQGGGVCNRISGQCM
jgi:hypothetical protein